MHKCICTRFKKDLQENSSEYKIQNLLTSKGFNFITIYKELFQYHFQLYWSQLAYMYILISQ